MTSSPPTCTARTAPPGPGPASSWAHGFTATRDDGLPAYAEAFRDAGFSVVVFDYRHFGASTGHPRQLLDIGRQHEDYRTAIAWARRLDGVDPDRIAVWGSSPTPSPPSGRRPSGSSPA